MHGVTRLMAGSLERRGLYKKLRPYKGKKPGWRNPENIPRVNGKFAPIKREPPANKTCYECSVEKPIEEFYKYRKMADGHLNVCKVCMKARVKARRQKTKEAKERSAWGDTEVPEAEAPKEKWVKLEELRPKPKTQWWEK